MRYEISGVLDKTELERIQKVPDQAMSITVSSMGGHVDEGTKIAEYLMPKNITLNVELICLSACASFLLPIGDSIKFIDDPVVGFHWSPIMDTEQFIQKGAGNLENCPIGKEIYEREKRLLTKHNLNPKFWEEIETRLNLKAYEVLEPNNDQLCPGKKREFQHVMWFPTSQQLRKLWGLKFVGTVCADDFESCKDTLDKLMTEGTSVIIGDKAYYAPKANE